MDLNLYKVAVSLLEVRSEPDKPSKVSLKRDTIINLTDTSIKYKGKEWIYIESTSKPIIAGYVPKRFLHKI